MHNVTATVEKDTLVIRVNISAKALAEAPASSSGKTNLVGTTSGSAPVADKPGLSYSLNVMHKPSPQPAGSK